MSQVPRPTAGEAAPRDARDGTAFGAELLAQVDLDAIGTRLASLPGAALRVELEGIVQAIDNDEPMRRRRRAGFFGRLLGRDLVAQAQPDPVDTRVRLHLSSAQALAAALAAQADALTPLATSLRECGERLRGLITEAQPQAASDDALARRLRHLDAIVASWATTAAQIDLARQHAGQLLERHAQVRDLLVPLWRQRASLGAASARAAHGADDGFHDSVRAQLAALRDALRDPSTNSPSTTAAHARADAERPTKESSP